MKIESGGQDTGAYLLFAGQESIPFTAQELLDLGDWIATNREQLQTQAQTTKKAVREYWQREHPYAPPNGSWQDNDKREKQSS